MVAPGRTRSGAPDAEFYTSPRTNHGSAQPLDLSAMSSSRCRPVRCNDVTRLAAPGVLPFQCCGPSLYAVRKWRGPSRMLLDSGGGNCDICTAIYSSLQFLNLIFKLNMWDTKKTLDWKIFCLNEIYIFS